jgi:hypothetical protein
MTDQPTHPIPATFPLSLPSLSLAPCMDGAAAHMLVETTGPGFPMHFIARRPPTICPLINTCIQIFCMVQLQACTAISCTNRSTSGR